MSMNSFGLIRHCLAELNSVRTSFSRTFYEALFTDIPEARSLFSNDPKQQELMLYSVMTMILRCRETGRDVDLELLEFGRRHARLGVRAEFFPVFGDVFLKTLIKFLPHWNEAQVASAWRETYDRISEVIISGMDTESAKMQLERSVFRPDPETLQ